MPDLLKPSDRLVLSGGYDFDPPWLNGQPEHFGTVRAFIPGQNDNLALVVDLDEPITVDGVTGSILILELRYVGASWQQTNTVHLELCDFAPEAKRWQDRRQGKWVESHATYRLLAPTS
jgi:hypothetical protein